MYMMYYIHVRNSYSRTLESIIYINNNNNNNKRFPRNISSIIIIKDVRNTAMLADISKSAHFVLLLESFTR